MNDALPSGMLEASRLTRAGRLTEATALLQRMLHSGREQYSASSSEDLPPTIDLVPDTAEVTGPEPSLRTRQQLGASVRGGAETRARAYLPEGLRRFFAAGVAVLAFVASSGPSVQRYLVTGDSVIGIEDSRDAANWTLDKVSAVSKAIDELVTPNEEIASFWPGYIFASKADPYPGFENDSGWVAVNKLTVDQRTKYHIISRTDIVHHIASHTLRIVVLGNQGNEGFSEVSEWAGVLRTNGYTAVQTIGDTSIFVCYSKQ